jgi:hypothetical protein
LDKQEFDMDQDLHRLVYYSRTRIGGDTEVLRAAVGNILAASRHNNAKASITGALMFNGGCFGQVLEGDRAALETTFERIQQDERHGDVSVLAFQPVEARIFGQWSMGFVGAQVDNAAAFAHVAAESGFDLSKADGDALIARLTALAIEDECAIA